MLMRKLFTLFAVMLMSVVAWAEEVTFDATVDKGTSVEAGAGTLTKDGVTIEGSQGILGNGYQYRIYKSSTMTVSSTVGNITKIEIEDMNGYKADGFSQVSEGALNENIWNGDAASIVFTAGNHQVRATKIVVTVGGAADTRTATTIEFTGNYPTDFTPGPDGVTAALPTAVVKTANGDVIEGVNVNWSLKTEKWKEGMDEPTIEEDQYIDMASNARGVIAVTASYGGTSNYMPSTKTYKLNVYSFYGLLSSLVEDAVDETGDKDDEMDHDGKMVSYWLLEVKDGGAGVTSVPNIVTYVNGKYTYLTDGKGNNMLFYGTQNTLKAGDKISGMLDNGIMGRIYGTLKRYNKLPELAFTEMNVKVESEGNVVEPITITPDGLKTNVNNLVKIEKAVYDSINGRNIYFSVAGEQMVVYNQFNLKDSLEQGATYTLTGMGSVYKKGTDPILYQLYLTAAEKTADPARIDNLDADRKQPTVVYSLTGRRVTKATKGIVVSEGRKQIVR